MLENLRENVKKAALEYLTALENSQKPREYIPASGKSLGKEELGAMIDASLDMWLTAGRFNDDFEEKFAQKLGYDTVSVVITKKDKAGYMPEVENITLKLVADRRSHRILGAQAIGCGDADKKINTISIGLANRITVENLLDVDLTYAPPFSTSVDILHSAARMLKSKLN